MRRRALTRSSGGSVARPRVVAAASFASRWRQSLERFGTFDGAFAITIERFHQRFDEPAMLERGLPRVATNRAIECPARAIDHAVGGERRRNHQRSERLGIGQPRERRVISLQRRYAQVARAQYMRPHTPLTKSRSVPA